MPKRRQFLRAISSAGIASVPTINHSAQPPLPPKIKIGQIGVAHGHASGKMAVYRASDAFEVVGIAEPDDALWERAKDQPAFRGLPRLSTGDLLGTPGLKAMAIETGVGELVENASTCIDAGMHVHLDKPAGTSLPEFRQLMGKADAAGLTVQMGYMYRYNPAVQLLHDFLAGGWLGDVFEVHTVMSKVVGQQARRQLAEFSGGIMFELGCHVIDLVVGVLGKPDKITPHIRSGGDDGLADNMLAVFDYADAVATVKSSAIEVEGFTRRHFVVCGTRGSFHIQPLDRPSARVALDQDRGGGKFRKGVQEIPFAPPYERYVGDAEDFAKIIRGEKKSDFPSGHDLAVQDAVLRASGMD